MQESVTRFQLGGRLDGGKRCVSSFPSHEWFRQVPSKSSMNEMAQMAQFQSEIIKRIEDDLTMISVSSDFTPQYLQFVPQIGAPDNQREVRQNNLHHWDMVRSVLMDPRTTSHSPGLASF